MIAKITNVAVSPCHPGSPNAAAKFTPKMFTL